MRGTTRNAPLSSTRRLAVCSVLALTLAASVAKADPLTVNVRGGVHESFDRIVFDWPQKPGYSVERTGNSVIIKFKQAAQFNLRPLVAAKLKRSGEFLADTSAGVSALVFTVTEGASVKDFVSGQAVGLDVTGGALSAGKAGTLASAVSESPAAPPAATKPAAQTQTQGNALASEPPPTKTEQLAATAPASGLPSVPAQPAPAAPPPPAVAAPPAVAVPPSSPPAALNNSLSTAVANPALPLTDTAPSASAALPGPTPPTEQSAQPAAQAPAAPQPPQSETAVATAAVSADAPSYALPELRDYVTAARFDLNTEIGIAAWARGGYGMIVLDRKLPAAQEDEIAKQSYGTLQKLNLDQATGYRFPLPPGADLRVTLRGTEWQIQAGIEKRKLPVNMTLLSQPDYLLGARLLLPANKVGAPQRFTDPVVGDVLLVAPLQRAGSQMAQGRRYADLDVLASAQGLVLRPLNENLVARPVSEGLEITAKGGLQLSPKADTGQTADTPIQGNIRAKKTHLFDFSSWRGKPGESFIEVKQRLLQTFAEVPEQERDRVRFEMARSYFAYGLDYEALAQLDIIGQNMPDLQARPEFLVLRGAARVMTGDIDRGLADLDQPDMANEPEVILWQGFGLAKRRDFAAALPKFEQSLLELEQYPEPFFTAISIMVVETALAQDQIRQAYEWLDRWKNQMGEAYAQNPAIQYLTGVIEHNFGHDQKAEQLWQRAKAGQDRLYGVRAEMALIELAVAQRRTTALEAARRLEGLRFAWRGDELEYDILRRLGNNYLAAGKHAEGLRMLSQAVKLYPRNPDNAAMTAKMVRHFHDMFIGPTMGQMTAMDALSVYQEFRNLVPQGEEGKAVIKALAERLVSVDLLPQAAGLLETLLDQITDPMERGEVGTRLAAIRILDQQGDAALKALAASDNPGLSAALQADRRLMQAKALAEAGQLSQALGILTNDSSDAALRLRIDILWRQQKWQDVSTLLEQMIGPVPPSGKPLTSDQATMLINRATALALAGDQAALDKLAVSFGPAMAGTTQVDSFRLLTRAKLDNVQDLALLQSKMTEVDLFRKVLNDYRAASTLSDTTSSPSPTGQNPPPAAAPATSQTEVKP